MCFNFLISDRPSVKKGKKKRKEMPQDGGAARRVCAERKEESGPCSQRAAAFIHVAIAAPATLALTSGLRPNMEMSAATRPPCV